MSKIVFSLVILIFLFISPRFTLAVAPPIYTPLKDAIFQDTPSITIEVNNDQDTFNPDVGYTFKAWNIARGENSCLISEYSKNSNPNAPDQLNVTTSKITASWSLGGCKSETGQYKFQLWSGQGTVDRNNSSMISEDSFTIQQAGGGLPTLTPSQQTVQLATKPTVLVSNAHIDSSYTFWWDPSQHAWAAMKKVTSADLKNLILSVDLDLTDGDFKAGVTRKLCMKIGDYTNPLWGVAGLTCDFSTTFTFSNNPPPASGIKCSILPSLTPTINDNVNLRITNAVPNTSYILEVKKDGNDFKTIPSQTVEANGNLIILLGSKLSQGTYLTHVFDALTAKTLDPCSIRFSVGTVDTSGNLRDICKETPDKCSSGGGKTVPGCTTDPKHPAIATAIGCIHTNPAELVKDLMTWVIGIGGGLAFLMMLMGAFQMLTSAGNPETLNAGKERLTSAVIGLLLVIFAILLLQIIGAGILKIPGFG